MSIEPGSRGITRLRRGRSTGSTTRIRRFDGEYRRHAIRGLPIRDERGVVIKWIGTATDIEDATQLEADLLIAQRETAETLTLLETLLSKAPVGFGFVDRDFKWFA
jgi:hypothetical protein